MSLTIGAALHSFRVDKNMSLKQVAAGIISSSFLSKLENGKTEISFSHLLRIIDRLNITFEELLARMNDQMGIFGMKSGLNEISTALYANNDKLLEDLETRYHRKWIESKETSFQFLEIISRGYLRHLKDTLLTKKDAETIRIYLYSIQSWGEFELLVFGNCVIVLPTKTLVNLTNLLSLRTDKFQTVNRSLVIGTLLNAANILIERGEQILPNKIFMRINSLHISENDFLLRQQFLMLQGLYEITLGHVSSGKKTAEKAIEIARVLGAKEFAVNDSATLKEYLLKYSKK
ncbi:helix-turn-helix domain-containing protein [Sporolactobacillus nakayamae]|uniref:Transcriptional activator, Rgg/GadR/MutR family, C-terminal domain-containing protein n=1 Tax=Sporolactobacillus nakayamae TaxID=269670 RepID=A0A1I2QFL6_9BACL|nr:Rgg/GadR/MutR family transcriptional regulator [Sporolactobacillus nakayamae]SFG24371.1 transcriptional activator, Rgg/GadR/MutR family, C-terminal domain-containing protein [Sporolactobacillus nakayamae]